MTLGLVILVTSTRKKGQWSYILSPGQCSQSILASASAQAFTSQ
jgi:hypothetical protein